MSSFKFPLILILVFFIGLVLSNDCTQHASYASKQPAFSSLDVPPPTLTAHDVAVVDFIAVAPFAVAVTFIVAITSKRPSSPKNTTYSSARANSTVRQNHSSAPNVITWEIHARTMMSNLPPRSRATQGSCAPGHHSEHSLPLI